MLLTITTAFLFMISFMMLSFVMLRAFMSGAEAYSEVYSSETARAFEDTFLFISPKLVAEASWAMASTAFILVFLAIASIKTEMAVAVGMAVGLIAGALAYHGPGHFIKIRKTRRRDKFNEQLVDALVNMSNALKSGFSIIQAFESIVKDGQKPIAQEFDVCLQQTRVGVSFSDALMGMEERVGSDDLTLMVLSIETARKTGGNLTEIFETIAHTIRERMRIEMRIKTLTAQGRLQGTIVSIMPIVIGGIVTMLRPQMMMPFLFSKLGVIIIGIIITQIFCGAMVIRKIMRVDV